MIVHNADGEAFEKARSPIHKKIEGKLKGQSEVEVKRGCVETNKREKELCTGMNEDEVRKR